MLQHVHAPPAKAKKQVKKQAAPREELSAVHVPASAEMPANMPATGVIAVEGGAGQLELRHSSGLSDEKRASNGVLLDHGEKVEILVQDTLDNVQFFYVKVGRKKGWIQSKYVTV